VTSLVDSVEPAGFTTASEPLTLGIDTSTVVCAGLARGDQVLASGTVDDTRAHAEELMPLVVSMLRNAGLTVRDLDAIAVGVGPGPFTGLRVGVVAACVLGEMLGLPVRGVCSLDVLAAQAVASGLVAGSFVVTSDARRKELYWARYDRAGAREAGPAVTTPETLPELPTCGPGTLVHEVPGPVIACANALDAGVLARGALMLPDAGLEPLYLRRPDADVPGARKSAIPTPRLAMGALLTAQEDR